MGDHNDGKAFEKAVHRFVASLGPGVRVHFDYKVPDRDTGTLRQCDGWIEGRFLGHFPIKYLISCKDKGRKLSIEDIGAFKAQIDSVGASSGAIYSRKGFYKPAIKKAKRLGIACCRLYDDQPADIPELVLLRAYATSTRFSLTAKNIKSLYPAPMTWGQLFTVITQNEQGQDESILDAMVGAYADGEMKCLQEYQDRQLAFPTDFCAAVCFADDVVIEILLRWKRYRAPFTAHLINGSFSLTDGQFHGQQWTPAIDTQGTTPGPDWIEMDDTEVVPPEEGRVVVVRCGADVRTLFEQHLSATPLPPDA